MATIYKREGSNFYMAGFKDASGRWVYRSTKTKIQAEAWRIAHELEGAGSTMKADNPTAAQIDRVVRSLWERHTGQKLAVNRADEFLRTWLANRKIKEATRTRYRQVLDGFIESLGRGAALDLRSITTSQVQAFVNGNEDAGHSGTTVALNTKILRAAFGAAFRAGYIETNPAASVEMPEAIAEERQPFTGGEIECLLETAGGSDWETVVMLGAFAGLRLGDAVNLRWEHVNLTDGKICFVPEKTSRKGRVLELPIAKRLLSYLEKLAGHERMQNTAWLCPTLAKQDVGGRAGLSAQFIRLMARAGLDGVIVTAKDGRSRKFARKSAHSLRHTFVSALANAGVAEDVRASLAGHADPKETKRYSHLALESRRKALDGAFGR